MGIGDRIVSGEKHPTPFRGTWDVVRDMPAWSLAFMAAALALIAARTARAPGRP